MTNIPLIKSALAKKLGITRQTINTWIKRGDLVFDETGKMSVDEFNRQLGHKLHPISKIRDEKYTPIFDLAREEKSEDVELDFHAARTIREIAEAKTAEFKLNVLRGDYVEREVVEKIIFERARQFRDGVMACSRRIAPNVAGMESIQEIEALIQKELRVMLEQFAKLPVIE